MDNVIDNKTSHHFKLPVFIGFVLIIICIVIFNINVGFTVFENINYIENYIISLIIICSITLIFILIVIFILYKKLNKNKISDLEYYEK
ncbi:hypothetical protein LCGC14_0664690 [marine sediment metagenome]|uniref:Uncharacterized protein n=1 Tax=marine sediment metagenome TaxID=412755 RepID=A0A0F9U0R2_9ZZZZ